MSKLSQSAKKERTDAISEWIQKGAEWCANQLWNARKTNETIRTENESLRCGHFHTEIINETTKMYMEANRTMHNVLIEHGIHPVNLMLYFKENDCSGCSGGGEFDDCIGCNPPQNEIIENISMYTIRIENGYISGIASDFEYRGYDCFKITNSDTGEVLYEKKGDKE